MLRCNAFPLVQNWRISGCYPIRRTTSKAILVWQHHVSAGAVDTGTAASRSAIDAAQPTAELYTGEWPDVGTPERLAQLNHLPIQST